MIITLIDNLPSVLTYLVQGYIFISVFSWIVFQKKSNDIDHIVLRSIAASFVLKTVYDGILAVVRLDIQDSSTYLIILIVCSTIGAYLLAVLCNTTWFNGLLLKIGIKRTVNSNIWNDVIKTDVWVRVYLKSNPELTYLGQYLYGEEFEREPIIVLANYQLIDTSGNIIIDYSQNPNEKIMLNTKDFERIELTY